MEADFRTKKGANTAKLVYCRWCYLDRAHDYADPCCASAACTLDWVVTSAGNRRAM